MLKKGANLVTHHWSPWRALKWGWGQELAYQAGGECPDPKYREQRTDGSAWGQLVGVPGGGAAKGPSWVAHGGSWDQADPRDQAAAAPTARLELPFPATGQGKPLSISSLSHSNGPSSKPTCFCW